MGELLAIPRRGLESNLDLVVDEEKRQPSSSKGKSKVASPTSKGTSATFRTKLADQERSNMTSLNWAKDRISALFIRPSKHHQRKRRQALQKAEAKYHNIVDNA